MIREALIQITNAALARLVCWELKLACASGCRLGEERFGGFLALCGSGFRG